jgi:outer membrane protein assembly factor BamB
VARRFRSIVWLVLGRVLIYLALCGVVVFLLLDFHGAGIEERGSGKAIGADESGALDAGWPHFRGAGYDGRSGERGLADSWPLQGPPVLWIKDVGAGYSGLIARGERIYTQGQGLTEQSLFALDADSGQTIWAHGYRWPYQAAGMFPGPRATPTWANGRIYFAAPDGLVGCVDAKDGRAIWSVHVMQKFKGRGVMFGYACSPVVEGGLVILSVGGEGASVVALDAETGATRWASGSAPASYSSVLPITFHGRRQVVALLQNELAGFDLETGRQLWEQQYARGYDEHASAVLYDEPYLRTMQAYRAGSDLYLLEAGPTGADEGGVPMCTIKRVRHDAQMSNDVASSVLVDGLVYGFDLRDMQTSRGHASRGTFRCMDFKTGAVRWSSDRPGQASIVAADGKLLMLNDRGEVVMARVNPDRYEELGRGEIFPGETCWSAPALHRGRLYLRSPTRAACLFVGKPERMSAHQRALATKVAEIPRVTRTDMRWLIGAERDYPFEMPDWRELARWYVVSLGALAGAGLLAGAAHGAGRLSRGRRSGLPAAVVFWSALLVLGIIATPLANRCLGRFVFTWPVSLLAVHQMALAAVLWSKQEGRSRRAEWVGMAGAIFLVGASVIYFKLTRQFSLAPAWYFLATLPASWPLAVPAARRLWRGDGIVANVAWMFAVFSVCFWVAGGVMLLRTALL